MKSDYSLYFKSIDKRFIAEHKFHPTRKWRNDYAIPELKIAIEIEGGVWVRGRHNRGTGFLKDMEKYNNLVLQGYSLLRFTPDQIERDFGTARDMIRELIQLKEKTQ